MVIQTLEQETKYTKHYIVARGNKETKKEGLHFAFPMALSTLITIIFYAKNAALRSALFDKIKEFIFTR
jgi:hypothetical protein